MACRWDLHHRHAIDAICPRRPARYYATLVEGERRMSLTDGSGGENGIAVVSCVEINFWAPHAIDAMLYL